MYNKTYIPMPPHSSIRDYGTDYGIVSCKTIKRKLAEKLLDSDEFTNGIDRELLKRSGIEDNSNWWYNNVDDLIMIKGRTNRYYIKKRRSIRKKDLEHAYQIGCDNYNVIALYVARQEDRLM